MPISGLSKMSFPGTNFENLLTTVPGNADYMLYLNIRCHMFFI